MEEGVHEARSPATWILNWIDQSVATDPETPVRGALAITFKMARQGDLELIELEKC